MEAFSSEDIWNLLNRGDDLRPGVSFQLPLDSQHFSIAISIPYLGVEKEISPLTRSARGPGEASAPARQLSGASGGLDQLGLKRLEGLTDFGEGRRLSWPRESSRLTPNRYSNVDNLQGNSVDEHFILKHRAGIILLNTSTSSGDDGGGDDGGGDDGGGGDGGGEGVGDKGMGDKGMGLLPLFWPNPVLIFHNILQQRHWRFSDPVTIKTRTVCLCSLIRKAQTLSMPFSMYYRTR